MFYVSMLVMAKTINKSTKLCQIAHIKIKAVRKPLEKILEASTSVFLPKNCKILSITNQ